LIPLTPPLFFHFTLPLSFKLFHPVEDRGMVFWIPVAKFLVLDWGDIVDCGIGLLYRPASLSIVMGRYDNHLPKSTVSP
jgi:hypothetical protein